MAERPSTFSRRLVWRLEALAMDAATFVFRLIPLDAASAFAGWVARRIGPLLREHRIADANLQIAFPEKDAAWRRDILDQHWDNLGRTGAEFVLLDRILADPDRLELAGREHLDAVLAEGRPLLMVTGHLGNWEMAMAGLARMGLSCWISYRPANNPYSDRRIVASRERMGLHFAPKGAEGSRVLIAALDRGDPVGFLNDQRDNDGVEAPFFGVAARTAGGPARLALRPRAAMIPVRIVRLGGVRFRMEMGPPLEWPRTGDRRADTEAGVTAVNRFMERAIRANPGQYLWSHRRWPKEAYLPFGIEI